MNLDNLKPAWRQFRMVNSMQPLNQKEILLMLDKAESIAMNNTYRLQANVLLFVALTFCCQGG